MQRRLQRREVDERREPCVPDDVPAASGCLRLPHLRVEPVPLLHERRLAPVPFDGALVQPPATGRRTRSGRVSGRQHRAAGRQSRQAASSDADQLLDVAGKPALYDIRVNQAYYDSIVSQKLYTYSLYAAACANRPHLRQPAGCLRTRPRPAARSRSKPPGATSRLTASACPTTSHFCVGRLGLVGLHLAQKTATHGEWIWASFEHAGNAPDCAPGFDWPIARSGPRRATVVLRPEDGAAVCDERADLLGG